MALHHELPPDEASTQAIAHHPPLYYALCVPLYHALRHVPEELRRHALRFFSTLLGAGVLLLVWCMAIRFVPAEPHVALAAVACVAWLPHFQLISSVINNDILLAALSTWVLLVSVSVASRGTSPLRAALLGGTVGLACLTKNTGILLLIPALTGVALGAWWSHAQDGEQHQDATSSRISPYETFLRNALAALFAWFALSGWWILQYIGKYGRLDSDPPWPLWAWPDPSLAARSLRAIGGLFRSTWSQVGWLPSRTEPIVYGLLLLILVMSLGGLMLRFRECFSETGNSWSQRNGILVLGLACIVTYGALIHSAIFVNPGRFEGGRYALMVVGATGTLLAVGLGGLPVRLWRNLALICILVLLLVCNALSIYNLVSYLNPLYGPK
ncbi:MAG: hypothetical protein AUJ92_14860 [Armatimonadetes bacterium CG2_30_59_28]|nr:MAG: hypothetical protein AUJ92_14860 [Armatimonadetes bacterium CG2_30_59_28]